MSNLSLLVGVFQMISEYENKYIHHKKPRRTQKSCEDFNDEDNKAMLKLKHMRIDYNKNKNLTQFMIDGIYGLREVYALNKKVAEKKYLKIYGNENKPENA